MRIIVQYDRLGRVWNAWFDGRSEVCFDGPTPMAALKRLMQYDRPDGFDPAAVTVDHAASTAHRKVYVIREPARQPCPECHGSGQYVGLNVVEPCRACDGKGVTPA